MANELPRPSPDRVVRNALGWFAAGAGLVLAFQTFWVSLHQWDPTVLLRVGSGLSHKEVVEAELGPVHSLDPLGHDGQINYLIARDPLCRRGTDAYLREFDNPAYRYRRILYPLLAGGGGVFSGPATLAGMIAWIAVGAGLAAAAGAYLAKRWGLPGLTPFLLLLNPGIYLSAQTLTADALALGFALAGVALWEGRREGAAGIVLAAATLVKEACLLVPICLALTPLFDRRLAATSRLLAVSGLPWLGWSFWVSGRVLGGAGANNFDWPGAGILTAVRLWPGMGPAEVVQGWLALLLVAGSVALAWRSPNPFLRRSCLAWAGLAMLLSSDVWGYPGNLLRSLAPLWAFAALAYGTCTAIAGAVDQNRT
jgi:hypothetical protein